jgi:protease I
MLLKTIIILNLILMEVFMSYAETKTKKAVLVIANENFRDEELLQPKEVLTKNGIDVKVAALTTHEAKGMLGAKYTPDITLDQLKIADYDALVFIGGGGSSIYWNNTKAHALAREAYNAKKIVGAICIAPVTILNSGILDGKKATAYESAKVEFAKYNEKITDNAKKVQFTGASVTQDGNIITANGPQSARQFGEKLSSMIKGS